MSDMKSVKWNEDWKYWEDKNSFALVWNIPEGAREVTLPHDAMIETSANADSPNGGSTGFRDGGCYTYVKNLFVEEADAGKKYQLRFEGVYAHALVYVNGQMAGRCANGYSTFLVDITNYLVAGGDNEIRVQVKNSNMPNSRWYSGGGIYRDVYLLTSGPLYLEPGSIQICSACRKCNGRKRDAYAEEAAACDLREGAGGQRGGRS